METKIQYPNLCAWCGKNFPSHLINVGKSGLDITGCLVFWVQYQLKSYTLFLPICVQCEEEIKIKKKLNTRIILIASIITIPLSFFLFKNIYGIPFGIILGIFFGSMVSSSICEKRKLVHTKQSWGTYEDGTLSFRNTQFYEKMKTINPNIKIMKSEMID